MNNHPISKRGGKRAGAGRPKGALTAKTRIIAEQAAERGITPLEVMLEAMMHFHEAGDCEGAAKIAAMAAPYVHPRLNSTEATVKADVTARDANPVDRPPRENREEWLARRSRELFALVPAAGSAN